MFPHESIWWACFAGMKYQRHELQACFPLMIQMSSTEYTLNEGYHCRGRKNSCSWNTFKDELSSMCCCILEVEFLTCFRGKSCFFGKCWIKGTNNLKKCIHFCDYVLHLAKAYHFNLVCTYKRNKTFTFGSELRGLCWIKPNSAWKMRPIPAVYLPSHFLFPPGHAARLHFTTFLEVWFIHSGSMAVQCGLK